MTRTTEVEGHFLIFCHLAFEFMYDIRSLPSQLLTLKLHPHVAINMKKDFSTKKTLPHPAPSVLSLLPVPYICRNILKSVAITQFVHKSVRGTYRLRGVGDGGSCLGHSKILCSSQD